MYEITKPNISYIKLSGGETGISETINAIRVLVDRYSIDWGLISLAREITRLCSEKDKLEEADALFFWLKENIKYYHDPIEAELLQNPLITIQERAGDCDDMVILLASLNKAIGNDIAYVTISLPGEMEFSHIYMLVICRVTGKIKGYDPASYDNPGYIPPIFGRIRVWYDGDNRNLAGIDDFFKKLFGWLKKNIKRAFKEHMRAWRRVRNEIGRAFFRIQKEFARWEDKWGIAAKVLIFGIKTFAPHLQLDMFLLEKIVGVKNPFVLSREEWKLLANIALLVASVVINIVTLGTTSYLLATAVILLLQTATTMIDIHDQKKMREEAMDRLRAADAKLTAEMRIKREALAKLECDVRLLDELLMYEKEKERILTETKIRYESAISDIWYSAKQAIINYRMQKELELQDWIKSLNIKYGVAI